MEQQQYAGFWIRVAATLIDLVVFAVVVSLPLSLIYGTEYWVIDKIHGFWDVVLGCIFPAIATIWFWRAYRGTPGKIVLKLRVVDAECGGRLTVAQSIVRYLAYSLSACFLGLGFVWVGFSTTKQGWHDKLAGTVVLRGRPVVRQ
jgi:uncharacterized RDD family membrane protein YckC